MTQDLVSLSVELAKAHLTQNRMSHRDVPSFIRELHETLSSLTSAAGAPASAAATASAPQTSTVALAAGTTEAESPQPALTASAPAASPAADAEAGEAPALQAEDQAGTTSQTDGRTRVAPVLHEDIDDPAFAGLDPWLAKRITPKMAGRLDASNPIHPSVFNDYIICLEDGEKVKLLRSYVQKRFGLSFSEYVDKWNLPDDYPTAPPSYLEAKRAIAKASGLGTTLRANGGARGSRTQAAEVAPVQEKSTGRGRKAASAKATTAKASGAGRTSKASKSQPTAARSSANADAPAGGGRGQRRSQPLMPLS